MPHLALDPAQTVAIDFDTFQFPKIELHTRSSGEELLMLVWSEGLSGLLLFDREIPRDFPETIAAVRAEVDRFNADPISGWRDLVVAAIAEEHRLVAEAYEALRARSRAAHKAQENAGFACLRARRGAA